MEPAVRAGAPLVDLEVVVRLDAEEREGAIFTAYLPAPNDAAFMALLERAYGKEITTRTLETVTKLAR